MTKAELRKRILDLRDALAPEDRGERSRRIRDHLFGLPEWPGTGPVLFFHTMRTEVETPFMMEEALQAGLPVALPRMLGPGKLQLFIVRELENDVEPNAIGILEPKTTLQAVEETALGTIIVPGVAFDPEGYRVGYGGGYYDRLLIKAPQAHRIAIAFDLQRVDRLPRKPHDVPVDTLVTESGHYKFHRRFPDLP